MENGTAAGMDGLLLKICGSRREKKSCFTSSLRENFYFDDDRDRVEKNDGSKSKYAIKIHCYHFDLAVLFHLVSIVFPNPAPIGRSHNGYSPLSLAILGFRRLSILSMRKNPGPVV